MKRIVMTVLAWIVPTALCAAEAPLGWPEVIGRLTQERSQAETCVRMIKSTKKPDAIAAAKVTYEMAKPRK